MEDGLRENALSNVESRNGLNPCCYGRLSQSQKKGKLYSHLGS